MRVLHIINNLANGGAERLLVSFLPRLAEKCESLELLVLVKDGSLQSYIDELESNNIKVSFLKLRGSLYNPQLIYLLYFFFRRKKYDIIHVHLFPSLYYMSIVQKLCKYDSKLFFTEHSINNRRLNQVKYQWIDKWIYASYINIVAISEKIKLKLDVWLNNRDKAIFVPNGVDIQLIESTKMYDLTTLNKWKENNKYIMMAARFEYPKRQDLLIKLFKKLPENYILMLAGDGSKRELCENLVKELHLGHRVFFLGHRPDILQLMKAVNLNILFSEYEGMSGVTIEALAARRPFLGSDVSGINDVVPTRQNLFSNCEQMETIKNIISKCEMNQDKLLKIQHKRAEEFDISFMVDNYINLYKENHE